MSQSAAAKLNGSTAVDARPSVFSLQRVVEQPDIPLSADLLCDTRLEMDGRDLLAALPPDAVPIVFFDPQYRGVLDRLSYGNEGKSRGRQRAELEQMKEADIAEFVRAINRVLLASGHLFLWIDKFHLMTDFRDWLDGTALDVVDMITWDKGMMGMGYRTRRKAEYLVVLQKAPRKAKGVWQKHNIPDIWPDDCPDDSPDAWPDVWHERIPADRKAKGVHPKPVDLQTLLIEAVSQPNDLVVDPAAGTFSVLEACQRAGRTFLGCDLNG